GTRRHAERVGSRVSTANGHLARSAILASREGEQLQSALLSRDLIGQAKGVIMARFDVDAVRAFEMPRQLSQEMNVRLTEIAQRIVDTR
ncbi:MAG: ANTAR domain-containing protein, partial [Mycobacterium sp.]|nr:ANTAR domain-containing protein [Mycobacterium sp.]